jgi:hypothetical protein
MVSCALSAAAIDRAHYRELGRKARKLGEQKDWAGLKQVLIEIGRELPADTPRQMLTMASVETHLGNRAEALQWMQKYAATGLTYDVASDDDLAPLVKDPAFTAIASRFTENGKTIDKAELVCSLPIADLMPEDLTYQSSSKTFFMSSVQHHSLYRVTLPRAADKQCAAAEVPLTADAKRWPTLAVLWDERRKLIWLTTSAMPGFAGIAKEDEGKASLLGIDGKSGRVLRRLDLGSDAPAVLGDMSIAKDGTLFVTDSIGGGVYRLAAGDLAQAKLEKIAEGLFSPQTPVATADGKRLLIADYSIGIAVVNLPPKNSAALAKVDYLQHSDNIAVTGLDGLQLDGNTLIGIQNGVEPERIMRFHLDSAQTKITSAEVIEQKTERLGEATHVIEVDGWYYVIANVGWDKIKDNGDLKPDKQFTTPVLLRFRAR